jgi:hypothetical protein
MTRDALTYDAARLALADALRRDADAHEQGRFDEIGRRFDALERVFPRESGPEITKLHVALTFWDAWIEARNLGWQATARIKADEWPALARDIAADLIAGRDITSGRVRERFDARAHGGLGDRVQIISDRLKNRDLG